MPLDHGRTPSTTAGASTNITTVVHHMLDQVLWERKVEEQGKMEMKRHELGIETEGERLRIAEALKEGDRKVG